MAEHKRSALPALLSLLAFTLLIPTLAAAQAEPAAVTIDNPDSIAIAPDGSIYFTDSSTRVVHMKRNSAVLAKFTIPSFKAIVKVAPTGRTYVYGYGYGYGSLDIYSSGGKLLRNSSVDAEHTNGYIDFAAAADGNLYFAYFYRGDKYTPESDYRDNVRVFNKKGELLREWGGIGKENGKFLYLKSIALGPKGMVFVLDNTRIQKFTPDGQYLRRIKLRKIVGKNLDFLPEAIAVNSKGNVLFAYSDPPFGHVIEIDKKRQVVNTWSIGGPDMNNYAYIRDIAVDADDNLYICDWNDDQIWKFSPSGTLLRTFHKLKKAKKGQ